jgi:hypothetical protein
LAHEFGHSQFSIDDEYETKLGGGPICGHTIMNGPDESHTLCIPQNHCTDPATNPSTGSPFVPTPSQCAAGSDGWTHLRASGKVAYVPAFTPAGTIPDQWDSLRSNNRFLAQISVTP